MENILPGSSADMPEKKSEDVDESVVENVSENASESETESTEENEAENADENVQESTYESGSENAEENEYESIADSTSESTEKSVPEKVTQEKLDKLVYDVVQLLLEKKITIATAESCTGGLISELITSVPGASKIFEIGVCTYSNKIKHEYLGVPKTLFKEYGAVSRQVALAMVAGLQEQSGADICVSVTGTAGPGGGTPEKPVGTIYVGISSGQKRIVKLLKLWELEDKSRDNIRMNAAYRIFGFLKIMVTAMPDDLPENRVTESSGKAVAKRLIPWKGDSIPQIIRKVVFLVSIIIFTVCLFLVVDYYKDIYKTRQLKKETDQIFGNTVNTDYVYATTAPPAGVVTEPPVTTVWELRDDAKQFLAKYNNDDYVGNIEIPGTSIKHAVMQKRSDTKNEYYINHDISNGDNRAGAIFLDYECRLDNVVDNVRVEDNSDNLIIYGHNMEAGEMFTPLHKYREVDGFYSEHPIVELHSRYRSYKYKIFACFIIDAEDKTESRFECWTNKNFADEKEFYDYVNEARRRSFFLSNVDVRYGDQLLTLQTCHNMFGADRARLYVMARMVRDGEDLYEGTENAEKNKNVKWPTVYYDWNPNKHYDPDAEFKEYPFTTTG